MSIKEYKNTESYLAQRDPAQREPVGGDEPLKALTAP